MNRKNKDQNVTCGQIQTHLIEHTTENLTTDIRSHLDICPECRQFAEILGIATRVAADEPLVLDPAIKSNLMKKIKNEAGESPSIKEKIHSLMTYRIPAYQALVAAAVVLIIVFAAVELSHQSTIPTRTSSIEESKNNVDPADYSRDSLAARIDQAKIGRNVLEDSAITKYLVTTM